MSPRRRRAGASLLEIQVAMLVFSIAVAGLCPLVVMQAKLMRKIETQAIGPANMQVIRGVRIIGGQPYVGASPPPPTLLLPQPDAWVRRLGVAATFRLDGPDQSYTPLPVLATADDSDPTSSSPGWSGGVDPSAIGGGYRSLAPGNTTAGPASWAFSGLTPGRYRVLVSYVVDPQNARDATYMFTDGGGRAAALPVNQQLAPTGADDAPPYKSLGVFYLGAAPTFGLGVSTTGRVVADAIQLAPAGTLNAVAITTPAATTSGVTQVRVRATPR